MDHATFTSARRAILRTLALSTMSLLIACTPAWQQPVPEDEVDLLSESKTLTRDGVTVTVAVPSAEQALLLFGTDLYKARVQPVWVRVENQSALDLTLMRSAIDDAYVSPAEAAYLRHAGSKETKRAMDIFFQESEFKNPIESGATVSGYVFTNLEEGYKNINIDLLGDDQLLNFGLAIKIPGLNTDVEYIDLDNLYSTTEDIDDVAAFQACLRRALLTATKIRRKETSHCICRISDSHFHGLDPARLARNRSQPHALSDEDDTVLFLREPFLFPHQPSLSLWQVAGPGPAESAPLDQPPQSHAAMAGTL